MFYLTVEKQRLVWVQSIAHWWEQWISMGSTLHQHAQHRVHGKNTLNKCLQHDSVGSLGTAGADSLLLDHQHET
eukprot:6212411-Amphidinium_carterae.2